MFGLLDCNNFYVSCERVFRPDLRSQPVIVLSNNDGCVIARSNESKALGIEMGTPFFKIQNLVRTHHIACFSSNYTLYGDMSSRIMDLLRQYVPAMEIYSIDEAFLDLSGIENLTAFGRKLVRKIFHDTGIPVSLGIAPTKTLAKAAGKFAKRYAGYQGCCIIDDENKRFEALRLTKISDIWGIGRQLSRKLENKGIFTAADFCRQDPARIRKSMSITGERLWRELQGQPCHTLKIKEEPNRQICSSRSFDQPQTSLEALSSAVAAHAARCAEKLRTQNSMAHTIITFICSNRFRPDLPQYNNYKLRTLPVTGNDSFTIIKAALKNLEEIYKPDIFYKKCGVIAGSIEPCSQMQGDLFDTENRLKSVALMAAIDKINADLPQSVSFAVIQNTNRPHLKQAFKSPCFTTKLSDIITIRV